MVLDRLVEQLQETLQKAYEARMGLIAQQQETELVKEEIDSIEELAIGALKILRGRVDDTNKKKW